MSSLGSRDTSSTATASSPSAWSPPGSLDTLWQSLLRDARHRDIQLINRQPVSARRFPDWSMSFSSYPSLHVQGMTGFFPVDEQGEGHMVAICRESAG